MFPNSDIEEAIGRARQMSQMDTFLDHNECTSPQNLLLYLFLREMAKTVFDNMHDDDAKGYTHNVHICLSKASKALKTWPTRIWGVESALQLPGLGPSTIKPVKKLFEAEPPEEPSAEEIAAAKEAKAATQKAKKEAAKKKRDLVVGKQTAAGPSSPSTACTEGQPPAKKAKTKKAYTPGFGTSNYAFLIVMYKEKMNGNNSMTKQDIMRKAEESGLSHKSIYGTGANQTNATGMRFHYDGWSSFKTLVKQSPPLVHVWSNPHQHRLSDEGTHLAAELYSDAVQRGNTQPIEDHADGIPLSVSGAQPDPAPGSRTNTSHSSRGHGSGSAGSRGLAPTQSFGDSGRQQRPPFSELQAAAVLPQPKSAAPGPKMQPVGVPKQEPEVLCIDCSDDDDEPAQVPATIQLEQPAPSPFLSLVPSTSKGMFHRVEAIRREAQPVMDSQESQESFLGSQSQTEYRQSGEWRLERLLSPADSQRPLRMPPLVPGRRFRDTYDVILLVDQRESFTRNYEGKQHGRTEALQDHTDAIRRQGVAVDVRMMIAGDAIWVARSRSTGKEYVLDAILERKSVDDLAGSIKAGRHETQKFFMKRSGLRMLFYLVEGDPDCLGKPSEIKAVKTASVQNEIIHGYRVLRTDGHADTLQLLAEVTKSLADMYDRASAGEAATEDGSLPTWEELTATLAANKKDTHRVKDVWGKMLMQVKEMACPDVLGQAGVGPDAAETIVSEYPTPISLYRAYKAHQLNSRAQGLNPIEACRQMLARTPLLTNSFVTIGPSNSKNIYDALFSGM